MNRIKLSPLATDASSISRPLLKTNAPAATQTMGFQLGTPRDEISIFVPQHYEKNYSYPLIVWLHSNGRDTDQLRKVMVDISMRNYVGIAPRATHGNSFVGGYWDQDPETIEGACESVMSAIDHAALRFNINFDKIFLAGMGAGGTMAFRLALESPKTFAGVLSINGPLPDGNQPLRDWHDCREVPVFWAHGRKSTEFGQGQLCRQLKLLHIAGFSVTLRQYPQQNLMCPKTMGDMNRWIMESISSAVID